MSRDSPRRRRGKTDTILPCRIDSIKPSNKWPLGRNIGHRGDKQMLVLSDLRSPDIGRGKREKPNDWLGPQNGSGAPFPSAEVNSKKFFLSKGSWQANHSHFTPGWRQKINWDAKDSKSFKPVLKTEQSLVARERRKFSSGTPSKIR